MSVKMLEKQVVNGEECDIGTVVTASPLEEAVLVAHGKAVPVVEAKTFDSAVHAEDEESKKGGKK